MQNATGMKSAFSFPSCFRRHRILMQKVPRTVQRQPNTLPFRIRFAKLYTQA